VVVLDEVWMAAEEVRNRWVEVAGGVVVLTVTIQAIHPL
jgi:hypothetical protein